MAIERARRSPRQPAELTPINWNNPLSKGLRSVWNGSAWSTLQGPLSSQVTKLGSIALLGAQDGIAAVSGSGGINSLVFNVTTYQIFPDISTTDVTVVLYRRCRDTTNRDAPAFGTGGIQADAPYSDGNIYWDCGRRTTASYTKDLRPETLVFVATNNASRGNEIWRRGVRIGQNLSGGNSASSNTEIFRLNGRSDSKNSDSVETYLFAVIWRAWSPSEIRSFETDPWQLFAPQERRVFAVSGGAAILAGNAFDQSSASGALNTSIWLSGNAFGVSSAQAALTTQIRLAGNAVGLSTATGNLAGSPAVFSGNATSVSTATGTLSTATVLAGNAIGMSSASGTLLSAVGLLAGNATSISTATGNLRLDISFRGDARGVSTATGDLVAVRGYPFLPVDSTIPVPLLGAVSH